MMKRYFPLLILPLLLAASCAPQAFVLNSEMRGPSKSGLDFAGNLDKIVRWDTLHRTVEYMRKHAPEKGY